MSQHRSLRSKALSGRHRNVLKRPEKIKRLKQDEKWDDAMKVFGLPKVRCLKVKVKKEKAAPKAADGAAAPAAAADKGASGSGK